MHEIKPIFEDLAHPNPLENRLHGGTQNPSESLNNIVWLRLPKTPFMVKRALELGVYQAVASFNEVNIAKCQILSNPGISPGKKRVNFLKKDDRLRIKKADEAISEIEKNCHRTNQQAKKRIEDMYEELEDPDNPPYEAGLY